MIIYIQPKADKVRGDATVWEFQLQELGWNDLPKELQYGIVLEGYEGGWLLVEWVAVSHTCMVAIDEVKKFDLNDKPIAGYTQETWNELLNSYAKGDTDD